MQTIKNNFISFRILFSCGLILLLFSQSVNAQVYGCTDPLAANYNASATDNDGSCTYPVTTTSPANSFNLANNLSETSGLIKWNDQLWTHNDNSDINLYALDTSDGTVIQTYPLNGLLNYDWEEISQDSAYVYVGDFGNNVNGNRTDLKIFRIEKNSLLAQLPVIDTITYSYSDQVDFTPTGSNNTDFDCEAFVVTSDSIYLFTKQWVSNQSGLYVLPKAPGNYVAELRTTFNTQGMITGATLMEEERIIALSGYTNLLQPFSWLLYDFTGSSFFGGNKRRIDISLPFHQVEGIATNDGINYFMTNEYFSIIVTPQKLHTFDFSAYLGNYLSTIVQGVNTQPEHWEISCYPNPAGENITVKSDLLLTDYSIKNTLGEIVRLGKLNKGETEISIEEFPSGIYCIEFGTGTSLRIIRK